MDEKGLLEESGGILERGLDGSLKSGGGFRNGLKFPQGGPKGGTSVVGFT